MNLGSLLSILNNFLFSIENYRLESELIVAHVMGLSRERVIFHPELEVSTEQELMAMNFMNCRLKGISLSHLLGKKEFWCRNFYLKNDVLSPRSETELIVEALMQIFPLNKRFTFADFGTGSGCLIVTILLVYSKARGYGCDCYQPAIINTRENLVAHKVLSRSRIFFSTFQSLLIRDLDLIICNPPYIRSLAISNLQIEVQNESRYALNGGFDGLYYYRMLVKFASQKLKRGGIMILEIGHGQLNPIKKIFCKTELRFIKSIRDLQGIERVIVLQRKNIKQKTKLSFYGFTIVI